MSTQSEVWKPIPEFEGYYEISNYGTVRGVTRMVNNKKVLGKVLKPHPHKKKWGYYMVDLSKDGVKSRVFVHQLVAMIFLGHTKEPGMVVDHIDNNRFNNHVSNLQTLTNRENVSKGRVNKTSKYMGVSWYEKFKKWRAIIQHNGKRYNIGSFTNEEDAKKAYDCALHNLQHNILPNHFGKNQRRLVKRS